ncbi:MnhB domain-containing protein [Devosia faecipullorum]|uniref:MnhB domain-containing protein n=1 Tax=Devosia faecipullorum TaxID=2755039 RepID=UPI00187BAE0E|nr:MnhB domain-containing protein [Devosia faecipullorum]MBE7733693.1 Na(+)/H(+) antiporter subunit B [Devosia faecipullorum]
MSTVIFRTLAPMIVALMLVFSVYVCLRGHNDPGGGFIGGLIAAASMGVFAMASGVAEVRRALRIDPMAIAGFGVVMAGASGLISLFIDAPFMTSIWFYLEIGDAVVPLSTPLFFDLGVYCVVFGTLSTIALSLEGDDGGDV